MNVTLTPDLERLIEEKVSSGKFDSATDVIRAGLQLLDEHARGEFSFMVGCEEELNQKLEEGLEALRRGEFGTLTCDEMVAQAKRDLRKLPNG